MAPSRGSLIMYSCCINWLERFRKIIFNATTAAAAAAAAADSPQPLKINSIPTKLFEGQKTGTSGLRKKALFNSLPAEDYKGELLVLGGDGLYFNKEAAQIIIKIAGGNGVGKILVGSMFCVTLHLGGYLCAVSAVIRKKKANGGFIMSASHNPGGPDYDWGIKFNYSSGQPAPESITNQIYGNTLSISEIKMADMPDIDLSSLGMKTYGSISVEVVDPVADYLELMETVFDFQLIKDHLSRPDFRF